MRWEDEKLRGKEKRRKEEEEVEEEVWRRGGRGGKSKEFIERGKRD